MNTKTGQPQRPQKSRRKRTLVRTRNSSSSLCSVWLRRLCVLCGALAALGGCTAQAPAPTEGAPLPRWGMVIHTGSGGFTLETIRDREPAMRAAMTDALSAGDGAASSLLAEAASAFEALGVREIVVSPWVLPFAIHEPDQVELFAERVIGPSRVA